MLLVFALLQTSVFSQSGMYFGGEAGLKIDNFQYVNSKGYALRMLPVDGAFGGYMGYNLKGYTFETGFYGYYASHPYPGYNYSTGVPSRTSSSGGSSGMDSWVIPLRFGKEFLFSKSRFFIKPEFAITTIIARDYSVNQPNEGWGENVSPFPGYPLFNPTSSDSTRAYIYRASKSNFGIESSFSCGFRLKKKADVYVKISYHSSFSPLYYETITHYSESETVYATSTHTGNALLMQFGLRYFIESKKQ